MELKKYLKNLLSRTIISLIILIGVSTCLKNNIYYEKIYNIIHYDTINYAYFNSKYKYLLGKILNKDNLYVSSTKLIYKEIKKYNNSYKLTTDKNLVINNINPGVVTFIGNIDTLGNTIIINGDNNIDYWYSNIENISVNLYDHINNEIIGSTIDNTLIITIKKEDEYLNYEGYI